MYLSGERGIHSLDGPQNHSDLKLAEPDSLGDLGFVGGVDDLQQSTKRSSKMIPAAGAQGMGEIPGI